jgi:hypothetical protein
MGDHAHHHHHHSPAEVTTPLALTTAETADMSHYNHGSMNHGDMGNHMLNHMMSMAVSKKTTKITE